MSTKHYNLSKEFMPGAIVIDEKRCFYSDYHTTVSHEHALKETAQLWKVYEEREETILADTDGGCDRIVDVTYEHDLKLEDAIFDNGKIVGFYFDFGFWNGYSSRPNSHIFMLDEPKTLIHYNNKSTWRFTKK